MLRSHIHNGKIQLTASPEQAQKSGSFLLLSFSKDGLKKKLEMHRTLLEERIHAYFLI